MDCPSAILVEGSFSIVLCSDSPPFWHVAHGNNPSLLKLDVECPQNFAGLQSHILQADKFLSQDWVNAAKNTYQQSK
jgi:hypothetical protein